MSQLPLNALRVFESVVRHGSFRAAAEELCVSQSAVSHQIRHLEQWFDTPLFDRSGSRPRALQRAEELADTLRHSLAEIERACERARPRISGSADLVIAAIPSVAVCWLIPNLADFRQRHPDVAIRIIYAFHGQALELADVDFAFVYADGQPRMAGIQAHYLLPGASVPVCSPAVATVLNATRSADTHEEAHLSANAEISFLHDSDQSGWQTWFQKAGATRSTLPGPVFEDFNLLRAAVLSGQGVALCPPAMLEEDLRAGRLVQLSDLAVKESWNYYLLEHMLTDQGDPAVSSATNAAVHFKRWLLDQVPGLAADLLPGDTTQDA